LLKQVLKRKKKEKKKKKKKKKTMAKTQEGLVVLHPNPDHRGRWQRRNEEEEEKNEDGRLFRKLGSRDSVLSH